MIEKLKYIYRAYRFQHKIDPAEISYIRANLKAGDVALDIGCHKGGYLYWIRKSVTDRGKVFAFEPQVKLFNYLQQVLKVMNFSNVEIENKGLSVKDDTLKFFIPNTKQGASPGARIDFLDDGTEYNEVEIEVTTLDKYCAAKNIKPNLIKIDVEGHEKQVLLGGLEMLKSTMPKVIMECENRHLVDGDVHDVFKVLLDLGYEGHFFAGKQLKPLKEFDSAVHQKNGEGQFWEAEGYVNNFVFEPAK